MTTNPPTLAVNDSVIIRLYNGTEQSAVLTHFSKDSSLRHVYAHFAWKTGPGRYDNEACSFHSSNWGERVLAVFPKDCKFLAV